jgi:phospholipid/cholesterol/gamma-HCH transport system substrate-binding protein
MRRPKLRLPRGSVKFFVFAVVCLVLLALLGIKIGNLSFFSSHRTYYAQLDDVTGLTSGDPVDIAGVKVGQVSSIAVQRSHALVGMSIESPVVLRSASDVGLRWANVIGQKDLYLYPSSSGQPLPPGSTIPLTHDVSDASVNALLNSLGPFLQSINPSEGNAFVRSVSGAIEGDTAQIDQLLNSGATVANTVGSLNTQVGSVITNLDQVMQAIASRSGDLGSLVSNLNLLSESLASHNTLLDDVVGNLSSVSSDLAGLIGANQSNLSQTIDGLNSALGTLNKNQQDLSQGLSGLGSGLAPYTEISAWGQWFQIQTVYTCLANQTACSYYQPTNPMPGSGLGGGPSGASGPSSVPSSISAAPSGPSSIPDMLGAVGGAPASTSASGQ